jgi:pilus assembly protein Flp/PilA
VPLAVLIEHEARRHTWRVGIVAYFEEKLTNLRKQKYELLVPNDIGRLSSMTFGQDTMTLIVKLLKDESGATAIEYGLIAAGISVAIIAVVQGLGTKLNSTFTSVQNALN